MENSRVELLQIKPMKAAYTYSLSQNPEEDALNRIAEYAKTNGLTQDKARLFGRNIYPTDQPEPHGYEYYLTVEDSLKLDGTISTGEVPGGVYAVLEVKNLFNLVEGWKSLFAWVEANSHLPVGVTKGEYGWVNSAFEELVDWQQQKPPTEWVFRLWVQLRE